MTYVQRLIGIATDGNTGDEQAPSRLPLVLVIEDGDRASETLQPICDFLEVGVERVPSEHDLAEVLKDHRPMCVIAHMDCQGQDGCHIMMTIAQYDRSLPVLLLVGEDPVLAGAADAIEELWKLDSVVKAANLPGIGAIVDFLFRAGRKGRCMRLMPI